MGGGVQLVCASVTTVRATARHHHRHCASIDIKVTHGVLTQDDQPAPAAEHLLHS